jgi:tetratricopeptide (TPR) repeat protein
MNAHFNLGMSFLNSLRYDSSIKYLSKTVQLNPKHEYSYFALACCYSLKKQLPQSIQYLQTAIDKGYIDYYSVLHDEDLDFIRKSKEYEAIVKKNVPPKFMAQLEEENKRSLEEQRQSTPQPVKSSKKRK